MALHILDRVPERTQLESRTTDLLQRLIRFDTVNPPGREQEAQEYLKALLEPAGFECELLSAVPGRPNLVARLRAPADGPRLCLLGHVDTVLADPSEWSVDPWSGELKDGCVWGRGALDMKSQVAAEAAAALSLAEEGWRPEAGELMLVFTCDEETGAEHGARWLCEQKPNHVACDLVVNEGAGERLDFEGRRLYGVCMGEKGVFRFTLTASGRAGHASLPRIGDNALVKLAPVLAALADGRPAYRLSPEPEAFMRGARARHRRPRGRNRLTRGARPARGGAARANAGRDAHADDGVGLREDQRHPVARAPERGLPGAARARRARGARADRGAGGRRRLRARVP